VGKSTWYQGKISKCRINHENGKKWVRKENSIPTFQAFLKENAWMPDKDFPLKNEKEMGCFFESKCI
jgi:hypothetical protein